MKRFEPIKPHSTNKKLKGEKTMKNYMNEYEKEAIEFLNKYNAKMTIEQLEVVDRFPTDDQATGNRYKYRITIKRDGKSYSFPFYDSINNYLNNERPNAYDIWHVLKNTKYAAMYGTSPENTVISSTAAAATTKCSAFITHAKPNIINCCACLAKMVWANCRKLIKV